MINPVFSVGDNVFDLQYLYGIICDRTTIIRIRRRRGEINMVKIEVMELLKGALRSTHKKINRKNIFLRYHNNRKIKWYIIFTHSQWRHVTLYTELKKNKKKQSRYREWKIRREKAPRKLQSCLKSEQFRRADGWWVDFTIFANRYFNHKA